MDSQRSNARRPLVVGNWKMHGTLLANERLLADLRALIDAVVLAYVDVAVLPPYPYLAQTGAWLRDGGVAWGAQDVAEQADGAFTGEVSAAMLRDLGCRWVTVGHSERRTLFGERDERVAAKAARALGAGLGVIVCVGETLDERQAGLTESVLARQVSVLAGLAGQAMPEGAELVLAYEPVWAIGTGVSASPQQAQAAHAWIRARLAEAGLPAASTRILYGGSVKADNAGALFAIPDIDGGLVGGAALDAQAFAAICRHALTV
jgi:triosephosphate isomerase